MIQAGLSLDAQGHWHVVQQSSELQMIVQKYPENFQGEEPVEPGQPE